MQRAFPGTFVTEAELLKRIAAADGDCALAAAAQSVHRSSMRTPNDHDPGVSTKSEVGKVPPQLKVVYSSIREFEGMGVWKVVFWVSF